MCTNGYLHTKSKHTGVAIHISRCLIPDSGHMAKNGQLSCRQKEESSREWRYSLCHIGIFVCGVLGSFDVLLVDQHLNALLDNGDGRGKARLKQDTCIRHDIKNTHYNRPLLENSKVQNPFPSHWPLPLFPKFIHLDWISKTNLALAENFLDEGVVLQQFPWLHDANNCCLNTNTNSVKLWEKQIVRKAINTCRYIFRSSSTAWCVASTS